jgi:hypothetical protein
MKLTDMLQEIEGDEDGMKQMKVNYDLAVQTSDIKAALAALNDTANYGIYAQNMRDPKAIVKAFGPSIPAQKAGASWKDWDERSEDEKAFKIIDIKNRVPEAWEATEKEAESGFDQWQAEGNEGSLNDYLYTLSGKSLPKSLVGTYGKNYFPMKTPDNLKKYAGKLEQDIHYIAKDGKIIFPSTLENPYKTKPYLSKVLKTIMDNAGVEFKLIDIEQGGGDDAKTIEKPIDEPSVSFKVTLDPKKIRGNTTPLRKMIDGLKSTYGKNFDYSQSVLTINNIDPSKKKDLMVFFAPYKQSTLAEDLGYDVEKYQMLRRAGIIK